MPCQAIHCHAAPCHVTPFIVTPLHALSGYSVPCHDMQCHVTSHRSVPCHGISCFCHAILCPVAPHLVKMLRTFVTPFRAVYSHAAPCLVTIFYALPRLPFLPCNAAPCLCHAILCLVTPHHNNSPPQVAYVRRAPVSQHSAHVHWLIVDM